MRSPEFAALGGEFYFSEYIALYSSLATRPFFTLLLFNYFT